MTTCAIASREQAEPLAATAATARTWLLLEQPGPWGADALTASRLDREAGRALAAAGQGTGVRVALIRRPGRHADLGGAPRRRVFAAHTVPGRSWVRTWWTTDPASCAGLDFAALGRGEHGGVGEPYRGDPLALVCTNGRRDRCCALLGRPLAEELAASGGAGVWEITHIGGHRFSPTLLVLPYGYAYGRADAPSVKDVLASVRRGRMVTERCRGRSAWGRPGQAAELAVRELTGEDDAEALTLTDPVEPGPRWSVVVTHRDGRTWRVDGVTEPGAEVAASCGAVPGPQPREHVLAVSRLG
ncbi:sucrase ferredoxin [Streptomyces chumphonensis]|uniref:Sucrase ferredoxin n=1 Tax=Streptomyces chumphonensis TaxID=1214925 RepID=A0A927F041_9ACTN|nr:sucrase ferredoxin [Streptomyces chumphonensis]MBD3932663.1 sucrase ferredoxin [Streptomyces chumphonensis]